MSPEDKVTALHPEGAPSPHGRSPGNGGSNYGERLARIEARMEYLATKEDIQKALSSQLRWMLGIIVVAALAALVSGATLALRLIDLATS